MLQKHGADTEGVKRKFPSGDLETSLQDYCPVHKRLRVDDDSKLGEALATMLDESHQHNASEVVAAMSRICALYPTQQPSVQTALSAAFVARGGISATLAGMALHAGEKFLVGACELLICVMQGIQEGFERWSPCVEGVVAAMTAHGGCGKLQMLGCAVLVYVSADYATHARMAQSGVVAAVALAMRRHPAHAKLQYNAISLLSQLSNMSLPGFKEVPAETTSVVHEAVRAMLSETPTVLASVMAAMRMHSRLACIQMRGCVFLDHMCNTDSQRAMLVAGGVMQHVTGVMCMDTAGWEVQMHKRQTYTELHTLAGVVQSHMCVVLCNCTRRHVIDACTATHPFHTDAVSPGMTSELVLASMLLYKDNEKMQEAGLVALANVVNFTRLAKQERTNHERIASAAVDAIRRHPLHANITKRGCVLLASLIEAYITVPGSDADAFVHTMIEEGGVTAVGVLMRTKLSARMLVVLCVLMMRMSVFSAPVCDALCAEAFIDCIVGALAEHAADDALVFEGFKSLYMVIEHNPLVNTRLGQNNASTTIVSAMKTHAGIARVQSIALALWGRMSKTVHTRRLMWGRMAGESPLIVAMKMHHENEDVQIRALWTLRVHVPDTLTIVHACALGEAVVSAIWTHIHNSQLQSSACLVLGLWHRRLSVSKFPKGCFARAAAALHMTLCLHPTNAQVQAIALGLLGNMYRSTLSLNDDQYAGGLQARVVYLALEKHAGDCSVLEGCFGVILNILGDNVAEDTRKLRLPRAGHEVVRGVIHVMRTHPASARLQENGCLILWKMVVDSPTNKREIVHAGGLELMKGVIQSFCCDSAVLTCAFGALESLALDDNIRVALRAMSISKGVVQLMQMHSCVLTLQGPASGLLCAVSMQSGESDIMHSRDIHTLLGVMKTHIENICVQTNCMKTLANIASSNTGMRETMGRVPCVVEVILQVSRKYTMSFALQNACFDALASIAGDNASSLRVVETARKCALDMAGALLQNAEDPVDAP